MEGVVDWSLFFGIGGVFMSMLCYYWHHFTNSYYWSLKTLEHMYVGDDILGKVNVMGGGIPYVALTGNVCTDEQPLQGLHNPDVQGESVEK